MTDAAQLDAEQHTLLSLVIKGMVRGEPDELIGRLVAQGRAMNKGTITMPTPAGRQAAGDLVRLPAGSELEHELDRCLDRFLPINRDLREVCSAWQTHPDGTPNDHTDAAYDDVVRERLAGIDNAIGPVLEALTEVVPRLGCYRPKLTEALDRFRAGESCWLASPLMDSYHTVWMHLHQELLLLLGLTRAEDEAREERLVGHPAR